MCREWNRFIRMKESNILMTHCFISGVMFDLTGCYTLAFLVGGGLCIGSAIITCDTSYDTCTSISIC